MTKLLLNVLNLTHKECFNDDVEEFNKALPAFKQIASFFEARQNMFFNTISIYVKTDLTIMKCCAFMFSAICLERQKFGGRQNSSCTNDSAIQGSA